MLNVNKTADAESLGVLALNEVTRSDTFQAVDLTSRDGYKNASAPNSRSQVLQSTQ